MKRTSYLLACLFIIHFAATGAFGWGKKCKNTYIKERLKCQEMKVQDYDEPREVKQAFVTQTSCLDEAYEKLIDCRLSKGRFKKGQKKELRQTVTNIKKTRIKCGEGCLKDYSKTRLQDDDFNICHKCILKCSKNAMGAMDRFMKGFEVSISDKDEVPVDYRDFTPFEKTQKMVVQGSIKDGKAWLACEKSKNKKKCHKKALNKSRSMKKKVNKIVKKDWEIFLNEIRAKLKGNPNQEKVLQEFANHFDDMRDGFEEATTTGNNDWPDYTKLDQSEATYMSQRK